MELNTKSPFMWDWDNLVVYPSRTADAAKKLQLVESEFEGIVEMGSFHSSGGSGGSVDSSTNRVIVETSDCLSPNVSSKKEFGGESLMGLKLGRRTYFEDVVSAPAAVKKSKSTASNESIHCQVEGCNLDLSSSKDYHRKHRVCENHSKTPKVVICGVERRFCQQCSRFHCLAEFDQKKRSCRKRLSDHNARRRKPKPEIIQFNSVRLPSSLHEGRSLTFNQVPVGQTRPNSSNTTWDFTKFSEAKQCLSPTKSEGFDSMPGTGRHETEFKLSYGSSQAPKSSSTFHQGGGFEVEAGNNELGALSLLSTNANAWGGQELDQSGMLLQLNQTRAGIDADYNNQQFQEFQLFKPPPNDVPNYYLYEDDLR